MGNLSRDVGEAYKQLKTLIARDFGRSAGGSSGGGSTAPTPPAPPALTQHKLADGGGLGPLHTVSGLTVGQVLKATGDTSARFVQLLHGELGGIGPDDHHAKQHNINDSNNHVLPLNWGNLSKVGSRLDHLEARTPGLLDGTGGSVLDVVGWTGTGAIGRLIPSADVRAGVSAILRSQAGLLGLKNLVVGTLLQSDSDNAALGINVAPDGAAALDIRAGAASDHSQRIRQIAGQTGRLWRIENTAGDELIVLDSQGNLQSGKPGFVSGLTGWQVTPVGNAEFNNGRFRGELHATVFVFDEVGVRNGTELITPAGGALALDATLTSDGVEGMRSVRTTTFADQDYLDYRTTSGSGSGTGVTARTIENLLAIKNPDTGHYKLFRPGEVLRSKVWTGAGISDTWMRVNAAVDMGDHWAYFVEIVSGMLPVTMTAGAAVAGYGKAGEGAIRISADDPYGPLIDIFTVGPQPWAGEVYPHVRMGRLDGVGVPGLSGILQWGIAGGANLADANSPYFVVSNLAQRMFKILSEWHDGANVTARIEPSGRARFGANVDSPALTFLDVNPALGLATFRGAIEVLAGSTGYANLGDKPTLGVVAAANNLDGVPDGATYARVASTLIASGYVRVGTGAGATLSGFELTPTQIRGALAGATQVVMGVDGAILGGGGQARMDAAGMRVYSTEVRDVSLNMDYENEVRYPSVIPEAKYRLWSKAEPFWYGGSNYAPYAGGDIGGLAALSFFDVDPVYPNGWQTIHALWLGMPSSLPKAAAPGYSGSTVVGRVGLDCQDTRLIVNGGGVGQVEGIFYAPKGATYYWQGIPSFRSTA